MALDEIAESLIWIPVCENPACGFRMKPRVIDLDAVVILHGAQCPRCLWILDITPEKLQWPLTK